MRTGNIVLIGGSNKVGKLIGLTRGILCTIGNNSVITTESPAKIKAKIVTANPPKLNLALKY